MTYRKALEYIHSVSWKGSRPGLSRIAELCERLGHPEDRLRFIHVAGTNGKGSTSAMLASILGAAGYRVGLFTSPFVERFNERIMLGRRPITNRDLACATELVRAQAEQMEDSPTEFELITAIAFVYYARAGCDWVVLECGLGGRLDSTNVISTSVLSIITGIALDHCAILGDTTAKIAAEKAGIIKPGVPVLFGEGDADAEAVIRAEAARRGSPYVRVPFDKISDVSVSLDGTRFRFEGEPVRVALRGLYQVRNTALVLTAVRLLRESGCGIPTAAVRQGLARARWKARFEILSREPLVVYDGAHNPQGIAGAAENIRALLSPRTPDGRVEMLMGVMADKEYARMIGILAPYASHVTTVTPHNARSLDAADAARLFSDRGVEAEAYAELAEGVAAAAAHAAQTGRPLLCLGSLYMYADVKAALKAALAP